MANLDKHNLSILTEFLFHHPNIPHATPSSPNYQNLRSSFIINDALMPPMIIRPPSAVDVASLVALMTAHSILFTIRSGGHDLFLRSMANNAVTIDLRDIAHVNVDQEARSARVGGGILIGDLAAQLAKANLATAYGTIPTVGYVGWAIHGGYGMLSALYGLGADQILGAKVVNASGELVDADCPMLKGIRGGGGTLGVIVELTIRVYPLEKVFGGIILYESQDLVSTIKQFNDGYRSLAANGLPPTLGLQQAVVNSPSGKTFGLFFLWSSSDVSTGEFWLNTLSSIAPVSMHTVATTTLPEWLTMAGSFTIENRYGSMFSINFRHLTPDTVNVISAHALKMPPELTTMFSMHEWRGPATEGKHPDSIFPVRQAHFMLEILPAVKSLDRLPAAVEWAREFHQAMLENDPGNLMSGMYLPFVSPENMNPRQVLGEQYQALVELKRVYDPQNIFQFALAQV